MDLGVNHESGLHRPLYGVPPILTALAYALRYDLFPAFVESGGAGDTMVLCIPLRFADRPCLPAPDAAVVSASTLASTHTD